MAITADAAKISYGAVSTLTLGGNDLGPTTRDGVNMKCDMAQGKFYIDQQMTAIKSGMTNRDWSISATLAHTHMANLIVALNLAASAGSGSCVTLNNSEAALAQLVAVVPCPGGGNRTHIFDSVRVSSPFDITYKSDPAGPAVLPITFEALYSSSTSRTGIWGDA